MSQFCLPSSVVLPLWTPTPVQLGAVGYHSRPRGEFITLFNSFRPSESPGGRARDISSLFGYGSVKQGVQYVDKRSLAQRAVDKLVGWGRSPPGKSGASAMAAGGSTSP